MGSLQIIPSWFMDLDNVFEIIVYYLLIEMIVYLGHRDRILMVSEPVYMVTHWIRVMVSYDIDY